MKVTGFLNAVCDALQRKHDSLSLDDTSKTVEEWDSIGHLAIIATIDEELGVPVNEQAMQEFSTIAELVERLKARGALED